MQNPSPQGSRVWDFSKEDKLGQQSLGRPLPSSSVMTVLITTHPLQGLASLPVPFIPQHQDCVHTAPSFCIQDCILCVHLSQGQSKARRDLILWVGLSYSKSDRGQMTQETLPLQGTAQGVRITADPPAPSLSKGWSSRLCSTSSLAKSPPGCRRSPSRINTALDIAVCVAPETAFDPGLRAHVSGVWANQKYKIETPNCLVIFKRQIRKTLLAGWRTDVSLPAVGAPARLLSMGACKQRWRGLGNVSQSFMEPV